MRKRKGELTETWDDVARPDGKAGNAADGTAEAD